MNIRQRLAKLELRVQPPKPVCTRRNEPDFGEFFRAKFGDEEAQKRYEESEDPGECHCEDCQKRRREQDADPEIQEFRRFFEAEYGKYARRGANDSSARVCEPASDSAGVLSPPRPADEASAVSGAVSNNNPTGDLP